MDTQEFKELREIGEETMEITERGEYCFFNGDEDDDDFDIIWATLVGPTDPPDFSAAVVVTPEQGREYVREVKERLENAQQAPANVYMGPTDTLTAVPVLQEVTPLVLNFGNHYKPGGGFLRGTPGQEPSLCRQTTLYASLSSKDAEPMYERNRRTQDWKHLDTMLLSPCVCVFRDDENMWLAEPFGAAVITAPAPDRSGAAREASEEEIDEFCLSYLRRMLATAAHYGYEALVLGAWGTGYFGNDPERVAEYFRQILFDERYAELFGIIIFSVPPTSPAWDPFERIIGPYAEDVHKPEDEDEDEEMNSGPAGLSTLKTDLPECNYVQDVSANNLGFAQGIMPDGTAFVAEIYRAGNDMRIAVCMPYEEMPESERNSHVKPAGLESNGYDIDDSSDEQESNIVPFQQTSPDDGSEEFLVTNDESILDIGMYDFGQEREFEDVEWYLNRLIDAGIVEFTTNVLNAAVFYRQDQNGMDVTKVIVDLVEDGVTVATTPLQFRSFRPPQGKAGKIIPFRSAKDDNKDTSE